MVLSPILVKVIVRILSVLLFTGLLTLVLWHAARFLNLPSKRQTTANAFYIAALVGGFILITGLVLILVPQLGESEGLRWILVIANMVIFVSMIRLFYQCSWKKTFQTWGFSLASMIVLGVFVGIFLGIVDAIF